MSINNPIFTGLLSIFDGVPMSTHIWFCAWCGNHTACCNDEHALGSGQASCCEFERDEGLPIVDDVLANPRPLPLEFCSIACFKALRRSMEERWKLIQAHEDLMPDHRSEVDE